MNSSNKKLFYGIALIAAIFVVAAIFLEFRRSGPTLEELESEPALYLNPDFKVSLRYPRHWEPDTLKRGFKGSYLSFGGEDGYFGIDALRWADSIDEAVSRVVFVPNNPYGTSPSISSTTIDGMEARFISPSADQPETYKRESAFIVRYPKPQELSDNTYFFFMLYGDSAHIQDLAKSLKFIGN